jgi:hypothetical protein
MSIAQTPYPEPTLPVITPAADPMARALAQSGQTSRPVIVLSKGALTRRRQSGHSRADLDRRHPRGRRTRSSRTSSVVQPSADEVLVAPSMGLHSADHQLRLTTGAARSRLATGNRAPGTGNHPPFTRAIKRKVAGWPLKRAAHRIPNSPAELAITIVGATKPKRVKRTSAP